MSVTEDASLSIPADTGPEYAEELLESLLKIESPAVDLAQCNTLHTAVFQVLLATEPRILAWPQNEQLASVLKQSRLLSTYSTDSEVTS